MYKDIYLCEYLDRGERTVLIRAPLKFGPWICFFMSYLNPIDINDLMLLLSRPNVKCNCRR